MKNLLFVLAGIFLVVSFIMTQTENALFSIAIANLLIIPFFIGIMIPVIKTQSVNPLLLFILFLDLMIAIWFIIPFISFFFGLFVIKAIWRLEHPKQNYR